MNLKNNSYPQNHGCYLEKGKVVKTIVTWIQRMTYEDLSDEDSWTEQDFKYSKEINQRSSCKQIPRTKTCINCTDVIIESYSQELFCSECQTKEDREREIRYQTFVADFYAYK